MIGVGVRAFEGLGEPLKVAAFREKPPDRKLRRFTKVKARGA